MCIVLPVTMLCRQRPSMNIHMNMAVRAYSSRTQDASHSPGCNTQHTITPTEYTIIMSLSSVLPSNSAVGTYCQWYPDIPSLQNTDPSTRYECSMTYCNYIYIINICQSSAKFNLKLLVTKNYAMITLRRPCTANMKAGIGFS